MFPYNIFFQTYQRTCKNICNNTVHTIRYIHSLAYSHTPEDKPWAKYDDKGNPTGNACQEDWVVVLSAWPGLSWEEASKKYHVKADKSWRFHAARRMYEALEKSPNPFNRPSSVSHTTSQALTVYYECAFLSESEIVKYTANSSRVLHLGQPRRLLLEDGVTTLQGYCLSLKGFTELDALAVRKVRFESRVAVEHNEGLLLPGRQIRREQGTDTFKFAPAKQLDREDGEMHASQ